MAKEAVVQAEYAIVGTLIQHPELIGETLTQLHPAEISERGARGLYEAMGGLFLSGAPVDRVTVLARAGDEYKPMLDWVLQWDKPNSLAGYCAIVKTGARLERMQSLAERVCEARTLKDAEEAMDKLNGAMATRHGLDIVTAEEAARDFLERIGSKKKPEYLSLGMDALDEGLYIERGDMLILGGYPTAGKTLLSVQFAEHLARKYRVGYYSIETRTKKLVDRLMAYKAQVPMRHIKRHEISEAEWRKLTEAAADYAQRTMDSIGAGGMSVRDIQAVALSRRHEVIFVDYLQLVRSAGKDRYEQVTNTSKDLHIMAQEHGITVIALAQLSRPEKTGGKPVPPGMSSFRESGQIEQDADVALLLWPEDPNDNRSNRVLKVGKNKEGEKLQLTLSFNGATQTLSPIPAGGTSVASTYSAIGRAVKASNRQAARETRQLEIGSAPEPDPAELPF